MAFLREETFLRQRGYELRNLSFIVSDAVSLS